MTDLRERIQERLKQIGKSARRASLDGGLHRDAIRNILRVKSKNPRRDTLEGLSKGLDWSMEELLELSAHSNISRIEQAVFDVPLISWVAAGALKETADPYEIGDAEEYVAVSHKRNTLIALRVHGASMNRIAPDGSVIIVDFADKILVPGQYYVVKLNGDATFKRYRSDPSRLEPDSTEAFDTVFVGGEVEVVGRVIQIVTKLA